MRYYNHSLMNSPVIFHNMIKKINIEVSAHDNSGRHIGDQNLNAAIWDIENIGGKYTSSIFVPSIMSKAGHYIVEFEFNCKEESPFIQPHMVLKY